MLWLLIGDVGRQHARCQVECRVRRWHAAIDGALQKYFLDFLDGDPVAQRGAEANA